MTPANRIKEHWPRIDNIDHPCDCHECECHKLKSVIDRLHLEAFDLDDKVCDAQDEALRWKARCLAEAVKCGDLRELNEGLRELVRDVSKERDALGRSNWWLRIFLSAAVVAAVVAWLVVLTRGAG